MAEIKCQLENLLQDDRITDEEWLALGEALKLHFIEDKNNILEKSNEERIKYVVECIKSCSDIIKLLLNDVPYYNYEKYENVKEFIGKVLIWIIFNVRTNENELDELDIYEFEQDILDFVFKFSDDDEVFENIFEKILSKGFQLGGRIDILFSNVDFKFNSLFNFAKSLYNFLCNKWTHIVPTILIVGVIRKRLYISDIFKEIDDGKINNNI